MFELLLVRHGETDWNARRRVMGMRPIGLNEHGRAQVTALAAALRSIPLEAIYASPAQRTMESAEILADGRVPGAVTPTPAFAEIDYGDWIGEPFTAIEETTAFADYLFRPSTFTIPGGEVVVAVQERAVAGVRQLQERHEAGRILIVTHADIVKAIVTHFLHLSLDHWQLCAVDNASLAVFRLHGARGRLLALNLHPTWGRLFHRDGHPADRFVLGG
ncbi:MAG: histidine phosphatase family protein [Deltaproteobacteria bacterium]|nr:histidine phosphatase family protein [Deltaproteobacteria bacterium]